MQGSQPNIPNAVVAHASSSVHMSQFYILKTNSSYPHINAATAAAKTIIPAVGERTVMAALPTKSVLLSSDIG